MNIFRLLFKKPNFECPRCLGKGNVDWNDIERLNKKLEWLPDKCAYCNGIGKIHEEMTSKVPVDFSYLTKNLPKEERRKILNGDRNANVRAKIHGESLNKIIDNIAKQYYVDGLDMKTIADLYFTRLKRKVSSIERQEFLKYAEKVVEFYKGKFN